MFARRFANQNRYRKREKTTKQDIKQITGVLQEVSLNCVPTKESGAISKIPVISKGHYDNKRVSLKGAVTKQVNLGKKCRNVTKTKKDVMPTKLVTYDDVVMVTCDNVLPVDETYATDIHAYMKNIESKCCPTLKFLQKDITDENRRVLLAWMRDVQEFLGMHQETFHLAITIIDLVLLRGNVKLQEYQLLGLVGFYLAAKFMERYVPEIDTLMYLASYAYNSQLILQKEKEVLQLLDYDLNLPTQSWFLDYYADDDKSASVRRLAEVLMDLFMLDSPSVAVLTPSLRAASSLAVANELCRRPPHQWQQILLLRCGYSELDLQGPSRRLTQLVRNIGIKGHSVNTIEERVSSLLK
ncbi:cyclin-A2-like [Apostichopus japonicus]|uniref:cyclin-A2-like n=1 Tax=Stichopus japonicus TaxID=307972 RepID=UPI003AB66B55